MSERLPTAPEIRSRLARERKEVKQAYYERRLLCRQLIFGKGQGKVKNLTEKEKKFCISVLHEAYNCYLEELRTGISRWRKKGPKWQKPYKSNRGRTLTLLEYRTIWWKGNKFTYKHMDVPRQMRERIERMRASGVDGAA